MLFGEKFETEALCKSRQTSFADESLLLLPLSQLIKSPSFLILPLSADEN